MQDQDKKQHAMTSFALFGMFASPREKASPRPAATKPVHRK